MIRRAALAILLALTGTAHAADSPPAGVGIEAPGPLGPLGGTYIDAGAHGPVVLMIPGSGATDRDGNNPPAVKAATLRLFAEALAGAGISSVRIDKRGMFGSKAAAASANAVTIDDYAADVHAWAKVIRAKTGARCVWLLGHSEGGLVALTAAQQGDDICGVVLVAAAGRRLGPVLREQLAENAASAPLLDEALPAIDALEAGRHVDTGKMDRRLLALFRPEVQDYLIDVLRRDPAQLIARYHGPVLILQGEHDIQIQVVDARALKAADPAAKLVLLRDATHMMKDVAGEGAALNVATYTDPARPLAAGAADAVIAFVKASDTRR